MNAGPQQGPPFLSLCMIVRNGGESLRRALQSALPSVDEAIVVDTGSTDDSRRIAGQLGARVVDFPWCDDFSAARNRSLDEAAGQWIFWMDADDVLSPESGRELRLRAADAPDLDAAFWVAVEEQVFTSGGKSRVMAHQHVRLFPRRREIRFCYRVHEQVAPAIRAVGLPIRPTKAVVRHQAARTPEAEDARMQRNLRLTLMDLQDRPDDPFVWLNLGATYLHLPQQQPLAREFLQRSAAALPQGSTIQLNAILYLGQAWAKLGDAAAEQRTYEQGLELFPREAMLLLRLAAVHERAGAWQQAAGCYETALSEGKMRRAAIQVREGPLHAVLRLGQVYLRLGRVGDAEALWNLYLQQHPQTEAVRAALLMLQQGNPVIVSSERPK